MKILIVDDVMTIRKVLRFTLEARGHEIVEADDGEQALRILETEQVDSVISDIFMPNMDGFRLCLEIRAREKFRHLPFIAYTETFTSAEDQKLAQNVGIDQYVLKSASGDTLVTALANALRTERVVPSAEEGLQDQTAVLKEYSESLVNKLEERNLELQAALAHIQELNLNLEKRVAERTAELSKALSEVKELAGLLPICSYCKRVRDDKNYWEGVESYVTRHSKARFSHGICPDCVDEHVRPMLAALENPEKGSPVKDH
jgi:CheY-like chemotaxis protein